MPLFGKSKKTSSNMSGEKPYPTQSAAQAAYPVQSQASPYGQPPPAYNQPPPGYSGYSQPPQPFPQQPPPAPVGVFDQGARFQPGQAVHVPPPPPGVAPTAAQMAAQQGQSVVMTQASRDVLGGGSDGGYTMF